LGCTKVKGRMKKIKVEEYKICKSDMVLSFYKYSAVNKSGIVLTIQYHSYLVQLYQIKWVHVGPLNNLLGPLFFKQ